MSSLTAFVSTVTLCILLDHSSVRGKAGHGCLTTQDDLGAEHIRQLRHAIEEAECQLVRDTSYDDYSISDKEVFDFIVVGGGSAGAVVANRLSENPDWKVLLLEAGGDPTVTSEVPAIFGATIHSELDWQYRTEPEPTNCLGSVNKRCVWPRGKVLGGSSAINAMLYVRGNPIDFDFWEKLGNSGWSYKHLLPYFKKSVDSRSEEVVNNKDYLTYHSNEGLLKIESFKSDIQFFIKTFSESFKELGYQSFSDVNSQHHEGFFTLQGTLENGRRCSTARAFLLKFQSRRNLKISKNSLVQRILIDKNKNAHGVQFTKGGRTYTVATKKEVILSAGSINSPQLLMLSGIGPQNHLKELGIEVIQHLNVGHNLQDHILMRGFIISLDISPPTSNAVDDMHQFLINSKGEFAGVGLFSAAGFIKTVQASYPNIQLFFTSFRANETDTLKKALSKTGISEDIQQSIAEINSKKFTLFVMPTLLRPKSRGKILLRSKNPFDHPLIYPGYFSEDQDIVETLGAVEFLKNFTNTQPMRNLGAKIEHIRIPGCKSFEFQTEAYWRCVIKHMSVTVYHPVGTCKMGPPKDSDSVVDPRLRVKGIGGLRVIDASIMPTITSGNTNAPTIAIAEKGSDLVKQFWKDKQLFI